MKLVSIDSVIMQKNCELFSCLAPSSAPETLSFSDITSTTLNLYWLPPLSNNHNGIIRSYIVKLRETNTNIVTIYNTTETTITIGSLHPYYIYECSVAAVTIDIGPYSSVIYVQTDEAGKINYI